MNKQIHIEFVKDFDGSYYANISINGALIKGLPEYVNYTTLKKAIKEKCAIEIPLQKFLEWEYMGRKRYAYYDACIQV